MVDVGDGDDGMDGVGVGCHPIHRGKPLCWGMSPQQGRWMGGYPFT